MQHTKRRITVIDRINDDTNCDQIIDFIDAAIDSLHLAVDAVQMLRAAADGSMDACVRHLFDDALHGVVQNLFAVGALLLKLAFDIGVFVRHEILERKILELAFDGAHTKAMRKRCIDVQGFFCLAHPFIGVAVGERAHIVQPVGKFNDYHAHISCDGQKQLAKILGLLLFFRNVGLLSGDRQLCDAVDQLCDFIAKNTGNIIDRYIFSVLNRIVQHGGRNARGIHAEPHNDACNGNRMDDIWLSGFALLTAMYILRIYKRLFKQSGLFRRVFCTKAFQELRPIHLSPSPRFE